MAEKTPGFPKSSLCLSGRCVQWEKRFIIILKLIVWSKKQSNCKSAEEKHTVIITQTFNSPSSSWATGHRKLCFSSGCFRSAAFVVFTEVQRAESSPHSSSLRSHPSASSSASSCTGTSPVSVGASARGSLSETGPAVVSAEADSPSAATWKDGCGSRSDPNLGVSDLFSIMGTNNQMLVGHLTPAVLVH